VGQTEGVEKSPDEASKPSDQQRIYTPPTKTRIGTAVGTKAETKMAEGLSRSSKTRLSEAAVRGFSVGSTGSTPTSNTSMPLGGQDEVGVGS
jgi:hypothetical protein